jgi:endonuclease-3
MKDRDIGKVVARLQEHLARVATPIVTFLAEARRGPFTILISTLLSLRTKDDVTAAATARLMSRAATPEAMLRLTEDEIARIIFPVGFYRTKARTIRSVCRDLIDRFDSRVPDEMDDLLSLKGVGRKTANLVLTLGFDKEGLCVDTHVHRISNRLGYVATKTPEETESALRAKLPKRYWTDYNTLLVAFGQTVCRPVSPFCRRCTLVPWCDRVGVVRSR